METKPPIPISQLRDDLRKALRSLRQDSTALASLAERTPYWLKAHFDLSHSHPSPSTLTTCRYQQWLFAKDFPQEQEPPDAWAYRSSLGIVIEPYLLALFAEAGYPVSVPSEPVNVTKYLRGWPDASFVGNVTPLIELKTKHGWNYRRLLESYGVLHEFPGEYKQSQLYLEGSDEEWCLYVATPADPALLQSLMRQRKRYSNDYILPLFYFEWIRRDKGIIEEALRRAEMLHNDLESSSPPPREYDGITLDGEGKLRWPCGYCVFPQRCIDTYGVGRYG